MRGFRTFLEHKIEQSWYGELHWTELLKPLVPLYRHSATKSRVRGQLSAKHSPLDVPVVVVGNITAGGTGKSPVVLKLAAELTDLGYTPGILSRGYGARLGDSPHLVSHGDSAEDIGDEPLMMALSAPHTPVVVDRDRRRGAQFLKTECGVDLVICDDGLQHYALPRDVEIVILDSQRGVGNGLLIPAGPLRESVDRLASVDFVLANGEKEILSEALSNQIDAVFGVKPKCWRNLETGEPISLDKPPIFGRVLAVSAIGNPERFHQSLRSLGLDPITKVFPDHYAFQASDFSFNPEESALPLVMTAKDAVKCSGFAEANWWSLEVEAKLPEEFLEGLISRLASHMNKEEI